VESLNRISKIRPFADETLMSYLRRAQLDTGYTNEEIQHVVAGISIPDSRVAERRPYDWNALSRILNATEEELHSMSERSLFYGLADSGGKGRYCRRASWARQKGYSSHCPCCLQNSEHWRKSWLTPDALTCQEHGVVLICQCAGCGGDLGEMIWRQPAPMCPSCGFHLSLSPIVKASPRLEVCAAEIRGRFNEVTNRGAENQIDGYPIHQASTLWEAARILGSGIRFQRLCEGLCAWMGLGDFADDVTICNRAVRQAQCMAIAYVVGDLDPAVVDHCWFACAAPASSYRLEQSIFATLANFEHAFGFTTVPAPVTGQLTMSFASWPASNVMPMAA
jgi:hypothetical protein